jgi:peptidoglycan/xylan/chitin deacetylase (PgdA/CDA1 family)
VTVIQASWHRLVPLLLAALLLLSRGSEVAAASARVVFHGDRSHPVIALTFDDGWGIPECHSIVRTLRSMHVTATFFPNSDYVRWAPSFWQRVASLGFPIGNHTASHPDLTKLSRRRIHNQIARDERVIESITTKPMIKVFRPPYGAYNSTVLQVAYELGYKTALLWDTTDADTSGGTDQAHLRAAMRGTNGSVLLMHCGPSVTPRILPDIIRGYRNRGFSFVTVPKLLAGL